MRLTLDITDDVQEETKFGDLCIFLHNGIDL